jgi:hypothetical protein
VLHRELSSNRGGTICSRLNPPLKASGTLTLFYCAPLSDDATEALLAANLFLEDGCVAGVAAE